MFASTFSCAADSTAATSVSTTLHPAHTRAHAAYTHNVCQPVSSEPEGVSALVPRRLAVIPATPQPQPSSIADWPGSEAISDETNKQQGTIDGCNTKESGCKISGQNPNIPKRKSRPSRVSAHHRRIFNIVNKVIIKQIMYSGLTLSRPFAPTRRSILYQPSRCGKHNNGSAGLFHPLMLTSGARPKWNYGNLH